MSVALQSNDITVVKPVARPERRTEVSRLLQRLCYTEGSGFRNDIIHRVEQRTRGSAFEIGVDLSRLYRLCKEREKSEWTYRGIMALLLIVFLVALIANDLTINIVALTALFIAALAGGFWYSTSLIPVISKYSTRNWAASRFDFEQQVEEEPPQNVIVHKEFSGFEAFGLPLSRWNVAINLGKGKRDGEDRREPKPVKADEVERAISDALASAQLPMSDSRDLYFIHGKDASRVAGLMKGFKPKSHIDPQTGKDWISQYSRTVRRYHWLLSTSWDGEIEVSTLLRSEVKGNILHFEQYRYVLGPISDDYKKYDEDLLLRWNVWPNYFIFGSFRGMFDILFKPLEILFYAGNPGRVDKHEKEERLNNPHFNIGAGESLRKRLGNSDFSRFAQRVDMDGIQAALDALILVAVLDFLEDRDIDVSSIRQSTQTIMNSGIIVRGGNVNAQALSVGDNAASTVSSVAGTPAKGAG